MKAGEDHGVMVPGTVLHDEEKTKDGLEEGEPEQVQSGRVYVMRPISDGGKSNQSLERRGNE